MEGVSPSADKRPSAAQTISVHQAHPSRSLDMDAVRACIARVAQGEGISIDELSVVLADHATVHELNRTWLGHDYETDVVSFPLNEDAQARGRIDGEIYVDLDTAAERAPDFDKSLEEEGLRYIIHGLLHLIGHDDATEEQRAAMRVLENRYLDQADA